jgi:hypothetical protein
MAADRNELVLAPFAALDCMVDRVAEAEGAEEVEGEEVGRACAMRSVGIPMSGRETYAEELRGSKRGARRRGRDWERVAIRDLLICALTVAECAVDGGIVEWHIGGT